MGQLITVKNSTSTNNISTYVLNRSLTGMENFTFTSSSKAKEGNSPAHVLAARILNLGAKSVSIYSNVVTVKADKEFFTTNIGKLNTLMEKLYLYYGEDAGWAPNNQN
jgi:hypothetical protein